MSNKSHCYNSDSASSKRGNTDIDPEVLERLLRLDFNGPLEHVEEIVISDVPLISPRRYSKRKKGRRGPKSFDEWVSEVRRCWTNLYDEDKLARSWIAFTPRVQKISVSKYGGGIVGRGKALKELLTQAVLEAKQYDNDEKTSAVLSKYPHITKTEIAAEFGMTREQFSRSYVSKATKILTVTFLRIIGRKVNA